MAGLNVTLSVITVAAFVFIYPFMNGAYDPNDFDPEYIQSIAPKMSVAMGLASRKPGDNK